MAGSDFVMLYWALSKLMAGSYRNRSTEYMKITIRHRIKKVIKWVCGGGIWDEGNEYFSKPIVNVIAMSNVGLFQDLNTFEFYSLCLRLLHFSS